MIQRKLGLPEAVEMALKSNLEIEIERTNVATAQQGVKTAQGLFDPNFRWLPLLESRATPAASVLQASNGKLTDHLGTQNFYFRQKLPWSGLGFNVDFQNARQSTSNPFVGLNPFFTSRLVVGFSQPLLRNRSIDRERGELKIRKKQVEITDTDLELRVIDVVLRVEQAYWGLVAARQDVQVRAENVELAREQLARTRRMIDAGIVASVEMAAAEAELERRLDTYYASVGALTEAENVLKTLLTGSREDTIWSDELIPTDESTVEPPTLDDLRQAVAEALKRRPELRSLALRLQTNDIQKQLSADQVKPQLNLVAGYANNGLGGTVSQTENPFTAANVLLYQRVDQLSSVAGLGPLKPPSFGSLPDILVGGYGSALSNVFKGRFQTVQAGLSFDFNLRNRTAEANLSQSVLAERRLKLEQTRAEQFIEVQVRNAVQAIETARQRITAAEASVRAAKEKLDSEIRLFQTGESTNFLVLTRQNEYADSRLRLVLARADFNRAVARAQQALGQTLQAHKISLK